MAQTVNPSSKRVIAVLAVLLAASLIGLNILFLAYNSEMNNKNAQIKDLNDQFSAVEDQIANQSASAPRLIAVGMHYIDNRTDANAPFLQVTGYVVNVGNAKANNCSLHLFAIQNGNGTALDTSAPIYPIEPGTVQTINVQFPYTGTPIVAYTSNLEWNK